MLVILAALGYWTIDYLYFPNHFLIPHFWVVFFYMAFITLLVYLFSYIGLKKGGDQQSSILLGAIVIRLILTLAFILIYTQKIKVDSVLFMLNFFSVYLLFTTFEIYCLLRNLRHQIKK
ncbi:hypothetical protein [Pedobacter segetis]|uniref:hypothetical protein n=1 Tax=Pedobacter segetis TaxID=2793069 RepID=UPI001F3D922D|nr:hypothetical protein [Pedobacter segetis]